ncbi:helix-turn-helix domain-containing protein [Haladaptatus sp. F3-133]|jgi:DNA-binding transcriptional ArsR family regulator|uniref:Helix-turn-helix domain-containing protein n=1 Tax=Halorutilus salinus TaxID=2487751 RepID=A0A9Q4C2A6_9EURY|nr:helix-turn-helix domain-containing protein [Halorutilus salinus]MCX2818577.1 helix-turn-helix domain-containing protein [Halorutilus salinus]
MAQIHGGMAEKRKRLQVVLQETRYVILQYVIGHPKESITLEELDHLIPDVSRSTIHSHLDRLVEADVLEKQELPSESRQRDLPHVFYQLSDDGEEFLEEHGLLESEETLKEFYDKIEKGEKAEKYERAPRPSE